MRLAVERDRVSKNKQSFSSGCDCCLKQCLLLWFRVRSIPHKCWQQPKPYIVPALSEINYAQMR